MVADGLLQRATVTPGEAKPLGWCLEVITLYGWVSGWVGSTLDEQLPFSGSREAGPGKRGGWEQRGKGQKERDKWWGIKRQGKNREIRQLCYSKKVKREKKTRSEGEIETTRGTLIHSHRALSPHSTSSMLCVLFNSVAYVPLHYDTTHLSC